MSVTVCIPCFNPDPVKLERALQSVYQQTAQTHVQIIVVDDGSKQPVVVDDPRVEVIRVTNRGLPSARNVALMNANGWAFLPLDCDDWLDHSYISRTLPLLRNDTDVVLTGIREHGPQRNKSYKPGFNMPWQEVTADLCISTYNRFFYASLFRTDTLRRVGGYNGRMVLGFEDWDLWIDLLKRGAKFNAVDDALFNYDTSNPDSMLSDAMRHRDIIIAEIQKHHRVELPCLRTSSLSHGTL